MKSIILTTFENNCPLHNSILLACNIANIINPIVEILKAKIIENWDVQLHALLVSCFIAVVLTSFTCCSAKLATSALKLLCLHSKYNIINVVIA